MGDVAGNNLAIAMAKANTNARGYTDSHCCPAIASESRDNSCVFMGISGVRSFFDFNSRRLF